MNRKVKDKINEIDGMMLSLTDNQMANDIFDRAHIKLNELRELLGLEKVGGARVYHSLEQQIIALWKSRDMDVIIKVQTEDGECIWEIRAPIKKRGEWQNKKIGINDEGKRTVTKIVKKVKKENG